MNVFLTATVLDYQNLSQLPALPPADRKIVHKALATLPAQIAAAKEKEMGDMMGKLKEVSSLPSSVNSHSHCSPPFHLFFFLPNSHASTYMGRFENFCS